MKDLAPFLARYPRATRPAAAVLARRAARHAGRVRRPSASCWIARRALSASGARRRRNWRSWSATSRRSCGCWTCGVPAQGNRKRRAWSRTKTRRSKTSGACCRTCSSLQESAAHGLRRGLRCAGIGRCAGAHGRQAPGGAVPHRSSLEGLREHLKAAESEPAGGLLRAARLSVAAGGQSGAAGGGGERGWPRSTG